MPIEIRDVDVHDDVLMRTYYDVAHEATTRGREFPTMPSAGEGLAKLRAALEHTVERARKAGRTMP